MAKIADVVKQGIADLQADLKEAKQSEEDDLGKVAQVFFDISEKADAIGDRLMKADEALNAAETPDDDEGEGNGGNGGEGQEGSEGQ